MPKNRVKNTTPQPERTPSSEFTRRFAAARRGDRTEFARLTEPHRRELLTHCYRMLGSLQDAEDLVQDTLLRAWRRLETYQGRASFRAWLYKIATNACLDVLKRRPKRTLPQTLRPASDPLDPLAPPISEPVWLEPFPDELLAPAEFDPEARYEARESITLAFMIALQWLPPRQRAVLIFRDVLNWSAKEVSRTLESTVSGVNSMLYRARNTLKAHDHARDREAIRIPQEDESTSALLDRYVQAWEGADLDGLIALLKEEATFPMPPYPLWYQGRSAIRTFLSKTLLAGDAFGRWRLLPLHANAQPAFACYRRKDPEGHYQIFAIQVLTFDGNLLGDITTFGNPRLVSRFGLPDFLEG